MLKLENNNKFRSAYYSKQYSLKNEHEIDVLKIILYINSNYSSKILTNLMYYNFYTLLAIIQYTMIET